MAEQSHNMMGGRGVSRPMAEHELHQHHQQMHGSGHGGKQQSHGHKEGGHGQGGHGGGGHGSHGGGMTPEHRHHMLQMHHRQTQWCIWTLLLLGAWMLVAPFSLGYLHESLWVRPGGGRGVWFYQHETADALRAWLMTMSDVLSGLVLIIFAFRSLTPNRPVSLWICCFVGVWLTLAPVLFWAPTAGAYLNNTLVGMLVIALSILIPGMPNMILYMGHGPPTPPGWSYNPSSWPQRAIMIALGFAGLLVSRYLAAYQLGYIAEIWDPFFGEGTRRVLDSDMSHMWPISDAALGTMAYTFEFLMGFMGSPARWRTMPWMVTFFGILVIPLGLVHIILVISQPVVVGEWCTFCLLAAAIMLPMIPLTVDEVVAMGQHMVEARRRGDREGSLWTIFWKGGQAEGSTPDERSPDTLTLPQQPWKLVQASLWGNSFPLTLLLCTALGVWLMVQPALLTAEGSLFSVGNWSLTAADVYRLGGALVVTVSVCALGEPIRAGRYLNLPLALILAVAPWFATDGSSMGGVVLSTFIALGIAGLSLPRGPRTERYGLWDAYVF